MNRLSCLAAVAALSTVMSAASAGPLTYTAPKPTITTPTPNQSYKATFHSPGYSYYADVTMTTTNQFVQISGGKPNQQVAVGWVMDITYPVGPNQSTVIQQDTPASDNLFINTSGATPVTLDGNGMFTRYASNSAPGSLSGTFGGGSPSGGNSYSVNAHSEIDPTDKSPIVQNDTPGTYIVTG